MKKLNPFLLPLFRSALFIVISFVFTLTTKSTLEQASRWWSIICTVSNMITILVLKAIFKSEGTSYREVIRYQKNKNGSRYLGKTVLLMVLLGVGGMYSFGFIVYGYIPVVMMQPIPVWLAVINTVFLPLTTVFAELPLYFGYSLNRIEAMTKNKLLAIAYPMFFYALQHSFIPLLSDWRHMLFRFLSFLPLLLALGKNYRQRRDLTPLMLGHAILDLSATIQILVISISPQLFDIISKR